MSPSQHLSSSNPLCSPMFNIPPTPPKSSQPPTTYFSVSLPSFAYPTFVSISPSYLALSTPSHLSVFQLLISPTPPHLTSTFIPTQPHEITSLCLSPDDKFLALSLHLPSNPSDTAIALLNPSTAVLLTRFSLPPFPQAPRLLFLPRPTLPASPPRQLAPHLHSVLSNYPSPSTLRPHTNPTASPYSLLVFCPSFAPQIYSFTSTNSSIHRLSSLPPSPLVSNNFSILSVPCLSRLTFIPDSELSPSLTPTSLPRALAIHSTNTLSLYPPAETPLHLNIPSQLVLRSVLAARSDATSIIMLAERRRSADDIALCWVVAAKNGIKSIVPVEGMHVGVHIVVSEGADSDVFVALAMRGNTGKVRRFRVEAEGEEAFRVEGQKVGAVVKKVLREREDGWVGEVRGRLVVVKEESEGVRVDVIESWHEITE